MVGSRPMSYTCVVKFVVSAVLLFHYGRLILRKLIDISQLVNFFKLREKAVEYDGQQETD